MRLTITGGVYIVKDVPESPKDSPISVLMNSKVVVSLDG